MLFICTLLTPTLILATLLLIAYHIRRAHTYWHRLSVPQLRPTFPLGNLTTLTGGQAIGTVTRTFYHLLRAANHPYGGVYALCNPLFIPCELNLIKRIMQSDWTYFSARGVYYNERSDPLALDLFNVDGERWKRIRGLISPCYTSAKMRAAFGGMVGVAKSMTRVMVGEKVDVKEVCCCYATDVSAVCSFGFVCGSLDDKGEEFRGYGRKFFEAGLVKRMKHFLSISMPEFSRKIGVVTRDTSVTNYFLNTFKTIMKKRQLKKTPEDLMGTLMKSVAEGKMSEDEALSQCLLFYIASFDTSATTMLFCFYELARNTHIQERLRNEVLAACPDGELTYEAVVTMKYLEQIVNEALRMYPPVPTLNRECVKNYTIPDTTVTIPKGTSILIPAYGIHYDPEYYPEPDRFDPDRFSEDNRRNIPPFAFLPFGDGPRNCIGLRFGLLQVKIGVAEAVRKLRFTVNSATKPVKADEKSFLFRSVDKILLDIYTY